MAASAELPVGTGTAQDFIPPRPTLRRLRDAALQLAGIDRGETYARRAFVADLKKVARYLTVDEREVRRRLERAD